ncbi:MAG: hypothetical protein RLY57_683 [Candidatus Parcubacteria bacterium]|jgi:hypothetical protein
MWFKFTKTKAVATLVIILGIIVGWYGYTLNDHTLWSKSESTTILYFMSGVVIFIGLIPLVDDIWADWKERR